MEKRPDVTSAKADILEEIRSRFQIGGLASEQIVGTEETEQEFDPGRLRRFEAQLERARATWARVAGRSEVPDAVSAYLHEAGSPAQTVVAASLRDVAWGDTSILSASEADYLLDGVAIITECRYGIAETGTLVSLSGPGTDAKLNFLAETHIVVLDESGIVGRPEDVWAGLRAQETPSFMPWAVHFITGPSRTADIEQTIELGAHGPRRLHVILVAG